MDLNRDDIVAELVSHMFKNQAQSQIAKNRITPIIEPSPCAEVLKIE